VAATFGKEHKNVLQAIRDLNCTDDFRVRNFAQSNFLNEQHHEKPCFEMTRDGFTREGGDDGSGIMARIYQSKRC
jgi:Rha family phage regulatory protein